MGSYFGGPNPGSVDMIWWRLKFEKNAIELRFGVICGARTPAVTEGSTTRWMVDLRVCPGVSGLNYLGRRKRCKGAYIIRIALKKISNIDHWEEKLYWDPFDDMAGQKRKFSLTDCLRHRYNRYKVASAVLHFESSHTVLEEKSHTAV